MYTHMCMINIRMCMFVCWDNSVRHWMASVYIFEWSRNERRGGRQLGNRRPSEEKGFKAGFGCGPSLSWTDPEQGLTHGRILKAEKTSRQEILLKDAGELYFSAVKQNWASQEIWVFWNFWNCKLSVLLRILRILWIRSNTSINWTNQFTTDLALFEVGAIFFRWGDPQLVWCNIEYPSELELGSAKIFNTLNSVYSF